MQFAAQSAADAADILTPRRRAAQQATATSEEKVSLVDVQILGSVTKTPAWLLVTTVLCSLTGIVPTIILLVIFNSNGGTEAPCEAPAHRMGGPAAAGADASRSNRPAAARCKSFEADTANAPRPLLCAGVRSDRLRWKMCCAPSGTSVAPKAGGVASKPRDREPNVPG